MPELRFQLRREDWPPQERILVRRLVLTFGVLCAVLVAVNAAMLRDEPGRWGHVALTVALVGAIAWLLARRRVRRARAQWTSFAIVLDGDRLRRELHGARTVEIARADVEAVEERPEGIWVTGGGRRVLAPRVIGDFDGCRAAIRSWRSGA